MKVELENVLPRDIEKRSFEIITEELGNTPLIPGTELIVKRCIHTSADFDYAKNLRFSDGAVEKALDAIRNGAWIVTDTQMAKAGINKRALARYGGEVCCFMSDEDVAKKAKEKGIHTTIDTAGGPFTREEPFFSKFQELMKYTDLLLVDIKHIDNKYHKVLTGRSNENILDMIRYLSDIKKPIWIRHVLVPERSDKDEYLTRLAEFIHSLNNVEKVEILPYHTMGIYKWKELGLEYPLEGIEPPTKERMENAKKILAI